ncbi:hypothetical protein, partial [Amphritea atlantica]|uniref:hypothetical protein n=1 Tax=Amphritea atlantica TaxID=355243 RepID=UPI001C07DEB6
KLLDLDQQLYQPNRQFFRSKYDSFSIQINAMWGFAPTRRASTHTQKQGEKLLLLTEIKVFIAI